MSVNRTVLSKKSVKFRHGSGQASGFTLVEVLVTLVAAMVVLAGLLIAFTQQYSEYKYQNKRVDAVQDLEFSIHYIANDLRSALIGSPAVTILPASLDGYTQALSFSVWDEVETPIATNRRAVRCYLYQNNTIYYNRNNPTCTVGMALTGFAPVIENVTYFRVFPDAIGVIPTDVSTSFTYAPAGISALNIGMQSEAGVQVSSFSSGGTEVSVMDSTVGSGDSIGYTILIETSVDSGYKNGSFIDVKGAVVGVSGKKRVWRYAQVHPMASVD